MPCSRLCGLLLYCVFRRSRRKLLREESIPAIATLRDCDGTFRLLCKRTAARYVYAQLSCLDRFMLHRWLCRAWGCGVTALRQRPAPCVSTLRQQARLPPHDGETPREESSRSMGDLHRRPTVGILRRKGSEPIQLGGTARNDRPLCAGMQSPTCEILSCLDLGTMVSEGLCSEGGHSSGRLPEAS